MKKINYLFVLAALAASASVTRATTVIPPTFDQLVDQAEVIFQGEVTNVKSEWVGEGAQRHIMSYVSFKVEDALKGSPGQSYTIRMLGGTVDGETMGVSDAPKFQVGDREILFVEHNGSQFIPLVGIMHGRFHLRTNQAGQEIVTNSEGESVKSVARLGKPDAMELPNETELTTADFKAAIQTKLQGARRAQPE
jgi:hypothetical protein